MSSAESLYFNAFNQIDQIGAVRLRRLLNHFPTMAGAWTASPGELLAAGLEDWVVTQVLEARRSIDPDKEYAKLQREKISLLTIRDEHYPKLLREVPQSPALLYIKGELLPQDEMAVAVVGTRKCSPYGRQVAQDLVGQLARANITIVSGLALGLDALAHRAALDVAGRTIAVLAAGLDAIYPAVNRTIAEKILEGHGALISELPLGTPPLKHHFPMRNRIISGLALGTVVIEAAEDSGALITARHALEQNRQVFAVPGSIYNPVSVGPNNLLKMGAKPVTSVKDILEDLNLADVQEQLITEKVIGDNEEENKILGLLTREPQHFDQIAQSSGLPAATVAATLTIMEMKGKVRNLGANQYVLSR